MSQRERGFHGGLRPGTAAVTGSSRALESRLRRATASVVDAIEDELGLHWVPGFSGADLAERFGLHEVSLAGVYPDGGVFVDADGRPRAASEAKRQGEAGNAIERWFKNEAVLRELGVGVYLTVCTGAGFFDHNSSQRILELAVATDPRERPRLASATVWNCPTGRLWLYRYATPHAAAVAPLGELVVAACRAALAGTAPDPQIATTPARSV